MTTCTAGETASPGREKVVAALALLGAVGFNLWQLWPEVAIPAPWLNDGVLHLLNLQSTAVALAGGRNPTDFWLPPVGLGYPLFHYYQHLPYLLPALVIDLAGGLAHLALAPAGVLRWATYLLLGLYPLSIYWSMRWFGFARVAAACAALTSCLLSTNGLYGFDLNSYVWCGYGLYTQLWGMVLLPMALARGYVVLKTGRGYFGSVLLLGAVLLSHTMLGYVALISLLVLGALVLLGNRAGGWKNFWQIGRRLLALLALTASVTAYFFIPFLAGGAFLNRSVWELPEKYNSYGYQQVLGWLGGGQLFDYGRPPVLTLLAAAGFIVCIWRWRQERYRLPVLLFVVWLLLYFGRPTWGSLLNLLPLSRDLQLHRFIAGVHLAGLMLIGIGLAAPWRWALAQRRTRYLVIPALLTALLLFPVYRERVNYLGQNAAWLARAHQEMRAEEKDISALVQKLKTLPPGRVYAGLAGRWGKDYRVGDVPMYALLAQNGLDTVGYLYHALSLNADVEVLFDDARREQYDLFNVRYVVVPTDWRVPPYYRPVGDFGRHRLYEVTTSGYFSLVGSDMAFAGPKTDLLSAAQAWLQSSLPVGGQYPTVRLSNAAGLAGYLPLGGMAQHVAQIPVAGYQTPRGVIVSEQVTGDTYAAQVNVRRDSLLLLKVTYHPNWHATIDGIETPTVMLMPSYIGVELAPGSHDVRLEYRPQLYRGILQEVGLLMLLLLALAGAQPARLRGLSRRSPRQSQPSPASATTSSIKATSASYCRTSTSSPDSG
jgi:hypothetical protein